MYNCFSCLYWIPYMVTTTYQNQFIKDTSTHMQVLPFHNGIDVREFLLNIETKFAKCFQQ